MIRLYDREECPDCAEVRRYLAEQHVPYELHPVPRQQSERVELLARGDLPTPEVPVLADGDVAVQGAERIKAWLRENRPATRFGDPPYGLTRRIAGVGFADLVPRVREALATEGFGVLTEIDVQATLRKKLDVDFRPYVILGACNPPLAHRALSAERDIGLLLPCNVVVMAGDVEGTSVVTAMDPVPALGLTGRADIGHLAAEVRQRLERALARVEGGDAGP